MSGRYAIIGTSFGALVAAERLSAAGHDVWIFGRVDQAGGAWRGVDVDGLSFDLGAFAIRQQHAVLDAVQPAAERYGRGGTAADGAAAAGWALGIGVPLVELPPARLHLGDGTQIADFLLGRSLEGLAALPAEVRQLIARDVRPLIAPPEPDTLPAATLRDALLLRFGATLVDACLEPWVHALAGVASEQLAPDAHEVLGVPLYAPERLLAALEGRPSIAPRVSLLRPHRGAMRALVRRVLDVLSTRTRVRWVPDVIERLEPRGAGVVVHLDHTVVAFDGWCAAATPDRLLLLLGHHPPSMPRGESRATVVCATVRAEADAAPLHVALDPALPLTVAVQPMAMDGRVPVTLDWSRRAAGVPDEVIAVASREALLRLGLADRDAHIDILRVRHLHSTAAPPTPEVIDAHRRAHAALRTVAGSAVLLGAAAPAMGVSPADDLGLGLQAATRLDGTAGGHGLAPRASRTSTPRALVVEERAPRVSVLLTLSGASAGTSAALHALLAQGVRDVEVVAVPLADASRAREAIAQFGARHPELPLTMFSGTSDGSPAAWMARAVSRSRAPVLVALDADDTLVPTALADAVQRLEAEPTLDAVFGDRLVPNGGHTVLKAVPAGGALDLSGRPRAGAWRRSLWTRVGGWREGALDPSRDFWVAAALAGATGASLGVPFVATPDAGDRAASLLLGHDLAARAEIVVARAAGFDSATVAVASALRAGLPVSRLVAVERPAPILVEGFVDWGDAAAIAGSLQDLVRAWDASRRYAADATTDAR